MHEAISRDILVGCLWLHYYNGKAIASFKYEESWLKTPNYDDSSTSIDLALPVVAPQEDDL